MDEKDLEIARLKEALETKKRLHTETNKDAEIARLRRELETRTVTTFTKATSDLDDELARLKLELETKKKSVAESTMHMETMKEEKATKRAEVIKRVVAEVDTKMNGKTLMDFYTMTAGQNVVSGTKTDKYGNADGRQFDLGKEGAFNNFSVMIYCGCAELSEKLFMKDPGDALKSKGFKIKFVTKEKDFIDGLFDYDVAWVVSSKSSPSKQFVEAVKKFHEMGRGVAIWADNDPWFATANAILKSIGIDGQIKGNYIGKKILRNGSETTKGEFGKHLVTSGITSLYEGVTICNCPAVSWLKPLATASDGKYCILYGDEKTGLDDGRGRVLVDCGFTKLFCNWDTAGTGRYVRNVCVWLLALDHKFTIMATMKL